ncbi:MAG: hypothetical protein ACLT5W_01810 [Ruminococcus sp.]
MINLVMNADKTISIANPHGTKIFQHDNLIDKLQIVIPKEYHEMSLEDFQVQLSYTTPGNIHYKDNLTKSETQDKENHTVYEFPIVDSAFTAVAGEIKDIALLLTKTVIREDAQKPLLYKLHTATTKLTIYPSTDYDSYITQGELSDEYEVVEF